MTFQWHCIPFNQKSIKKPDCKAKVADGSFKCADCRGSQLISINEDVLEGIDMGKKKPCIVAGCSSPLWKGDYCYKHHPEAIEAKQANPKSMVHVQARIEKEVAIPVVVERPAVVQLDELHVIDILQTIREKRQADLDAFIADLDTRLQAVPTAAGKIVLAAQYL